MCNTHNLLFKAVTLNKNIKKILIVQSGWNTIKKKKDYIWLQWTEDLASRDWADETLIVLQMECWSCVSVKTD